MEDGQSYQMESLLPEERLGYFNEMKQGCQHLWSKGEMVTDRVVPLVRKLYPLTVRDPFFLAHVVSYEMGRDSKDRKVISVFINALSDADGTAIVPGSEILKPNLRQVSAAALQRLEPKLVLRVVNLARMRFVVDGGIEGRHFPVSLRTAVKRYLRYREQNLPMLEGCVKSGLRETMMSLYRMLRLRASDEACKVLKWRQRDREIAIDRGPLIDFSGLDVQGIADRIRTSGVAMPVILSMLQEVKVSPVIGLALLEICTPKQAVVYQRTFDDLGILRFDEVLDIFGEKVAQAESSADRVKKDRGSLKLREAKQESVAKSHRRSVGNVGKVFIHVDKSGSLGAAIDAAKRNASKFAEAVGSPEENLRIGLFDNYGRILENPEGHTEAHYARLFYGMTSGGGTNCAAMYSSARDFDADIDVFLTDQRHLDGCGDYETNNLYTLMAGDGRKPRACCVVNVGRYAEKGPVVRAYERLGVPVTEITGDLLDKSTGVGELLRTALLGSLAVVEEIMGTELLEVPGWYFDLQI